LGSAAARRRYSYISVLAPAPPRTVRRTPPVRHSHRSQLAIL